MVTPEDTMGDVIGDLNSRRGVVLEFTDKPGGLKQIKADVPLRWELKGLVLGFCGLRA